MKIPKKENTNKEIVIINELVIINCSSKNSSEKAC